MKLRKDIRDAIETLAAVSLAIDMLGVKKPNITPMLQEVADTLEALDAELKVRA